MSDAGSPKNDQPPAETKPKADGTRFPPESERQTSLVSSYNWQAVDNTLNIKIVSTDGSEVFFKIKKTTKLNKLKVSFSSFLSSDPSAYSLGCWRTEVLALGHMPSANH
jgi:hypothetical protein